MTTLDTPHAPTPASDAIITAAASSPTGACSFLTATEQLVDQRIRAHRLDPWGTRRSIAKSLFEEILKCWWASHAANPNRFASELDQINRHLGLSGDCLQQATLTLPGFAKPFLLSPKFVGGSIDLLDENFVVSLSLNHAIVGGGRAHRLFADELRDQQSLSGSVHSHLSYFSTSYVHKPFFGAREKVLAAFAATHQLQVAASSPFPMNASLALYLETLPTRSSRFASSVDLNERLSTLTPVPLILALNRLTHRVVFELLQPKRALLAGQATWSTLPPRAGISPWGTTVYLGAANRCPVHSDTVVVGGTPVHVVRTNFLRTQSGPNSNAQLAALGALIR